MVHDIQSLNRLMEIFLDQLLEICLRFLAVNYRYDICAGNFTYFYIRLVVYGPGFGPGLGKVTLVLLQLFRPVWLGFLLGIVIPISETQVCVHKDGSLNATHLGKP